MPKPSDRKNIDFTKAIVRKTLGEVEDPLGYSGNLFMMFGLPTQKLPPEQKQWVKENSKYCFTITQTHKDFDIPYGCYARINQIFIDTEIKTKSTNRIELGNSMSEFTKKVGYTRGGACRGFKKQLCNLIRCSVGVTVKTSHADIGFQSLVGRKWFIALDEHSPDQLELFKSSILLDEVYTKYIYDHAAPLDMAVVRFFNRNPLALDFYRLLAYRNNELGHHLVLKDADLFEQLGTSQTEIAVTRFRLHNILSKIKTYWKVNSYFEDGYFHLLPSPPAVEQRNALRKPLKIVHNLVDN